MRVLLQRRAARAFVEDLLEAALAGSRLGEADRALLRELVCGVVRWQATLDWLIVQRVGGRTQKPAIQVLLRLGLYQMFWLDRIPDHAAVHETVLLAKRFGCGPQSGFVNAVLRGCLRERDALERQLEELKSTDPALGYSHPDWLVARWRARWTDDQLRRLLEWNNTPPRNFARVNTLRTRPDGLREWWAEERVEVRLQPFPWAGDLLFFELLRHRPLARLESFQRGCFYVQDPSTALAVCELNPQPGETILDFCAAPGGKTTLLAQLMQNRGRLVAHDPAPDRLARLKDNCARLGVTCLELDAPGSHLSFDRILLDVPCSNTGVLRRRVELRWRLRPEEITRLRDTQLALLEQAAPRLKPGGTLAYSTCSLEPEENHEVVRTFLTAHPEFHLLRERALLPFADGVDGAYVAVVEKVKS